MIGAIIGDIVGSRFEFHNIKTKKFELLTDKSRITDDSVLTAAVMDLLLHEKKITKKKTKEYFKKWCYKYPHMSYGAMFSWWLRYGEKPYYSFGNGAAMRVSPIAYYSNSIHELKRLTRIITKTTHNHPEGLKGAEVTAVCIFMILHGKSKLDIYNYAVSKYPEIKDMTYQDLKKNYKFNETCQESVPQAIYCFLISKSFEDCLRTTISIGGDSDTLCAINGPMAEAFYGNINQDKFIKYIPKDIYNIVEEFYNER